MERAWFCLLIASSILFAGDPNRKNIYVFSSDRVVPQIADGGEWKTILTLVNMDDHPVTYKLNFYRSDGTRWSPPIAGIGRVHEVTGTIPLGGSVTLETQALDALTTSGWALLDKEGNDIGGMAIFRSRAIGRADAEAVVPFASRFDDRFYIPFNNRDGFVTAIAICNPDDYFSATVFVEFRSENGQRIVLDTFNLTPLQHMAFSTTERYPETLSRRGIIEFNTPDWGISALGLRFNPTGSFTSSHPLSR